MDTFIRLFSKLKYKRENIFEDTEKGIKAVYVKQDSKNQGCGFHRIFLTKDGCYKKYYYWNDTDGRQEILTNDEILACAGFIEEGLVEDLLRELVNI